ncbi:hypothetical protein [Actinomadura harenae]|uniref:Uncharacterized protein n=1 Tax=Actinomadura harenae TaxID=2483351 RepID=A0A3M2LWU3_9ACTN|nr:hypothetical protein [Actinomadura harenae]RMI40485.1 hypothetical protein EBO15_26180 [Actinomadura harenae]
MTDQQPGDLLDEAAKLLDAVRRRVGDAARAAASGTPSSLDDEDDEDVWGRATKRAPEDAAEDASEDATEDAAGEPEGTRAEASRGGAAGEDVWAQVLEEERRAEAGPSECQNCPVCRAIALARESGPDVRRHVEQAGRSLLAALSDVVAAYERTRSGRPGRSGRNGPDGPAGSAADIG